MPDVCVCVCTIRFWPEARQIPPNSNSYLSSWHKFPASIATLFKPPGIESCLLGDESRSRIAIPLRLAFHHRRECAARA